MPDSTKAFLFASKVASKDEVVGSFDIDGESFDIRALPDAQVAYLVYKSKSGANDDTLSAVLDFLEKALTPESIKRFEKRALRVPGGLTMVQIVEVFRYVLEVVGTFPTGSASSSSSVPRKTGTASRGTSTAKA